MRTVLTVLVLWAVMTAAASAEIVGSFVPVTEENGTNPPTGFVTNDLVVTATTDWLAANLLLVLTEGSIHHDPLIAGIGPPSPALIGVIPAVAWDTYVTGPGGPAGGAPSSAGGAVDLGGNMAASFTTSLIDLQWFNTDDGDIGTFALGRFTLSDDARGSFLLRLDSLRQSAPFFLSGRVIDGQITHIPEPTSIVPALLGAGTLAAVGYRRRKAARRAPR